MERKKGISNRRRKVTYHLLQRVEKKSHEGNKRCILWYNLLLGHIRLHQTLTVTVVIYKALENRIARVGL